MRDVVLMGFKKEHCFADLEPKKPAKDKPNVGGGGESRIFFTVTLKSVLYLPLMHESSFFFF